MANKIDFQVDFNVNKSNLTDLSNTLQSLQRMTTKEFLSINNGLDIDTAKTELQSLKSTIGDIQNALNKAYNTNLNSINVSKFNKELKSSNINLNQAYNTLNKFGNAGQSAFRSLTTDLVTTNVQLKQSHKLLDSMAQTMANTVRFGLASSVFNKIANEIQKAYDYSIKLDTSLNDIRIVSDKSADDMERFAVQANKAAKALGSSTLDYTKASTIYYQQGLGDKDVAARTETTLKTANVTGQAGEEVSEQLTAIWNGYKVSASEAELYIDKVARVAATTAADLEELSTGMSKTASAANAMEVDFDNLNAMIATVVSVTREAPETIGTSFRSIFSRMTQLEADGTDEFGVTLSQVTSKMEAMGVSILDQNGQLKDMDDILADVAGKWDTWSKGQQVAAARVMAGTQQYSRFIALMDNQDMWNDALEQSKNAFGELDRENEIYLESTAAHLQKLSTTWEKAQNSLIDNNGINTIIDAMTSLVDVFGNFIDATGKGVKSLVTFGAIGAQIFGKQITQGIGISISNSRANRENKEKLASQRQRVEDMSKTEGGKNDQAVKEMLENVKVVQEYYDVLSNEEINESNALIKQVEQARDLQIQWENTKKSAMEYASLITGSEINTIEGLDYVEDDYLSNTMTNVKESIANTSNALADFNKVSNDSKNYAEDMSDSFMELVLEADNFQEALSIDKTSDFSKSLNNLFKIIDNNEGEDIGKAILGEEEFSDLKKEIDNNLNVISKGIMQHSEIAKNGLRDIEDVVVQDIQNTVSTTDKLNDNVKKSNDTLKENTNKLKDLGMAETFTNLAQGATQLTSALMTLTNIPSIFVNEDLTSGEKFLQIMMALSTAVPMLVGGFSNLQNTWSGTIALLPVLKTKIIDMAIAHKAQATASEEAALGETALAAAETAEATTSTLATPPTMGLAAALWELLAPLLPFVIAAGAVTVAVYALVKAFNADADAAKKMAQQINEAKERVKEAKQAYSELNDTISNYKDAQNSLKNLTTNTVEWYEAIQKANESAKELINQWGLIANKDYKINTSGLIEIDPEVIAEQQMASMQEIYRRSATENLLVAQSYQKEMDKVVDKFKDSVDKTNRFGNLANAEDAKRILTGNKNSNINIKPYNFIGNTSNKLDVRTQPFIQNNKKNNEDNIKQQDILLNKMQKQMQSQQLQSTTLLKDSLIKNQPLNQQLNLGLSDNIKINLKPVTIDLTEQVKDFKSEYDLANAQYIQAIREAAANLIRGYADSDTLEKFNSMTSNQQKNIEDKVAERIQQKGANIPELKTDWNWGSIAAQAGAGATIGGISGGILANPITAGIGALIGGLFGGGAEAINQKIEVDKNREFLREQYAENALGYTKQNDIWVDKNGRKVKQETIDNIDIEEAKAAYESGEYYTKQITETIVKMVSESQKVAMEKGFGADSQEYIAEAVSAVRSGKQDYDFSVLTEDEKNEAIRQLNEYGETVANTEETIAGIGEVNQEAMDKLVNSTSEAATRAAQDVANYKEELKSLASELDTTSDALELYGLRMKDANKDTSENSKSTAKQVADEYKLNKAYNEAADMYDKSKDTFEAYSKAIKNHSKISYDTADSVAELKTKLEDMFGVDVSAEFMEKNFKDIQKMLIGTADEAEKAFERLQNAAILESITNTLTDVSKEYAFTIDQISTMMNEIGNLNPGEQLNEQWSEQLINFVNNAHMTAAEVEELFNNLNIEVPPLKQDNEVDVKNIEVPGSASRHYYKGQYPVYKDGEMSYEDISYYWDEWSEPKSESYVSINNGTKLAKSSGGNKSSGGLSRNFTRSPSKSSGSSGGSKKDPDTEKKVESEKDPYHDVDIQLKDISTKLDKVQSQQSKFFGQKLINNLNEQYELLGKQIDKTREKITIARQEQARLQSELSQKGVTFNTDGTIANYAAAYDAQLNYVNSLIDRYNAMSADEQEKFKETLDNAKEDFNKFTDAMSEYDTTVSDTIPQLEKDIQDAIDKQIEINISKFNMEIKIRLDLAEAERDWNEFKKKVIDGIKDDNILDNTRARLQDFSSYYKQDGTGVIQRNTVHVEDILEQLRQIDATGTSTVYGDNKAQALEDLKTYYEQLMQDLEDIVDLQEEVHESYLDMMDEAQEKFDEQLDTYEQISTLIEHDMKLIKLTRGENSYDELSKYYEKQQENYQQQVAFQKQQVDFWKQQMDVAEQGSEEWKKAKENWIAAIDDWRSTVNDAIEQLQDKYLNMIDSIFDKLNNKVTDGLGLDYVNEEWELINKNADQYLDTINAMYGIQKLENKYLDAIDNTDSISAQRKLNDLMNQELESLREKDKLTQYDIDRANMKYEIALKQIALEEAQQNKSSMRLKRDSQGNYSYQFVSDADETGQIQDELADLNNQLYNFDKDHLKENLDEAISLYEEFIDKLKELYSDPTIDPEQREQRRLLLTEQYGDLINGIIDQNEQIRYNLYESGFTELADLYNVDYSNFEQLSNDEKDILMNDMLPMWDSGVQHMIDKFAGEGGFEGTCKDALTNLAEATKDYQNDLTELEQAADMSFDAIANGEDYVIDQTRELLQENEELINSYERQLDAVRQVINELETLIGKYNSAEAAAKSATEAAYKYWQEQQRQAAEAAAKEAAKMTGNNSNSNSGNNANSGGSNSGSGGGNTGNVAAGQEVQVKASATTFTRDAGNGIKFMRGVAGNKFYVAQVSGNEVLIKDPHGPNYTAKGYTGWVRKTDLEGFRTGGYTGDWPGDEGRLALIHKKELMLNADDTPNMLKAVSVLRNITANIGSNVLAQMAGIKAPSATAAAATDTIEQNVHIDASFPNATSSKEIEDAFHNLVHIASQRTFRNKK